MEKTPKSLRLQIGIFGRTNVGKSSFLNYITNQDIAITSPIPGTTTDVVEKPMELLPIGPVVFLDTAGIDDSSALGSQRLLKTQAVFERADVFVVVATANEWTPFEDEICSEAAKLGAGCLVVVNKIDINAPSKQFIATCAGKNRPVMSCSCLDATARSARIDEFKSHIARIMPEGSKEAPPLISDLITPGAIVVCVVPIDLQAPRGRLIMPQVQTIRETLDCDATAIVVKEREYAHLLGRLAIKPDLVVCDSQVVLKVVADTPLEVKCTTFSILFSRSKGDLQLQAAGLGVIDFLKSGDRVLIAEACTHHALEDDIGRIKIPRWLRQYTGADLVIDVLSGRDYPHNIADYKLIVHCGSCMTTRRETLARLRRAADAGVAITNYGLCISFLQGVLERALGPFPAALDAFKRSKLGI
jgi:[FeFe] hydrogenase H-cluster maturation GTPase HydF